MILCLHADCNHAAEIRTEFGDYMCEMHRPADVSYSTYGPMSVGGDLPLSRRCFDNDHENCKTVWTQYPDGMGACQCSCHVS